MQGSILSFLFRGIVATGVLCCLVTTAHATQLPDFIRIVEQNMASVATISVKKKLSKIDQKSEAITPVPNVPKDSKLKEFFGRFFEGQGGTRRTRAIGSGLIISSDGRLLTTAHLVKDATKITVTLEGGKKYQARLVGLDDPSDIALLKISTTGLRVPRFGDSSKLRIGEWELKRVGPRQHIDYYIIASNKTHFQPLKAHFQG
jgi:serine protease Do